jgi:hypothetical protein
MKTLLIRTAALMLALPLAHAQLEDQTDARQQQLINEAIRSQSVRNFKDVLREDGGDVVKKAKWADFQVGLLQDFEYETNANFNGNSGEGSFSYSPTVFAAGNAKLNEQFRLSGIASWTSTWYEGLDNSDFWGVTGGAYLNYRPMNNWPEFFTGVELNRYESWDDGSEISKSVSPVVGLRNNVRLGSKTGLFYNLRYSHRWTDPGQFDRDQFTINLGLNHRLAKGLFIQPGYSFGYYDYVRDFNEFGVGTRQVDREDLRHEFSLSLVYRYNTYLSFRLSGTFVDNDSTLPVANYQNFSTGLNSGIIYNF